MGGFFGSGANGIVLNTIQNGSISLYNSTGLTALNFVPTVSPSNLNPLPRWISDYPIYSDYALRNTKGAAFNTANGFAALLNNNMGGGNTAYGAFAGYNTYTYYGDITSVTDDGFGLAEVFTTDDTTSFIPGASICGIQFSSLYSGIYAVTAVNPGVSFTVNTPFIGNDTGTWFNNDIGSANTFIGAGAGYNFALGNLNITLGAYAGYTNDGTGNVLIGPYAGASLPAHIINEICFSDTYGDQLRHRPNIGLTTLGGQTAKGLSVPQTIQQSGEEVDMIGIALTWGGPYVISSEDGGIHTGITGIGVHGLTAAVAVGKSIYVIYSGVGWNAGFYTITGIDVDTIGITIIVNTPFTAQGNPVIALAGTEVEAVAGYLLAGMLGANGALDCRYATTADIASGANSTFNARFGTDLLMSNSANVSYSIAGMAGFTNANATNAQISNYMNGSSGLNLAAGNQLLTASQDTTAITKFSLSFIAGGANDVVSFKNSKMVTTYGE